MSGFYELLIFFHVKHFHVYLNNLEFITYSIICVMLFINFDDCNLEVMKKQKLLWF